MYAGEFDLFEETSSVDQSMYRDYKFNKFRTGYSFYPQDQKKFGISFSRTLTKRLGFTFEYGQTDAGNSFSEKAEIIGALNYRFSKRSWSWIFTGDLGFSANDDVEDLNGIEQGFRINHLMLRFSAQYIFQNGFGFDYSMTGRMTLETGVDEEIFPMHSLGIVYQF
jgi:hypothetical protein